MDLSERLAIDLDYWDDSVGTFDPAKVLRKLQKAFPEAEIDPTDHQRVRLLRELEFWSQSGSDSEVREQLIRQSWNLYQTNGPTYHFAIPIPSGQRVEGVSRRLTVAFEFGPGLPSVARARLVTFLQSLRLGELIVTDE